jgi:hypothetical protein
MTKLLTALRRTLGERPYSEPAVHFHAGSSQDLPEVCHEGACERPRLAA